MSAKKGSNGPLDGQQNIDAFLRWAGTVRDFKPYVYQGVLSISRAARESGLLRDVFYTNPDIRDIHWPQLQARLESEGVLKPRVTNPVTVLQRTPPKSPVADARTKQIQEENEAIKAENRELRRQLEKLKDIDELVRTTGRVPW